MPKITAIKPQKKEGRFNIYLDGKFAFGIDEETLVREKLEAGQDVDSAYVHKLVYGAIAEKLVDKALKFLSFRPRSEKEIRDYLWRKVKTRALPREISRGETPTIRRGWGMRRLGNWQGENEPNALIDEVIGKLGDLGYLDDAAFVSWWLEQRIRFKPRGKILLRSELYEKGVDRDLIEEELSKYTVEDELSWAQRLVEKKISQYENLDAKARKEKLSSSLARQGFSWEVIEKVIDSVRFSL